MANTGTSAQRSILGGSEEAEVGNFRSKNDNKGISRLAVGISQNVEILHLEKQPWVHVAATPGRSKTNTDLFSTQILFLQISTQIFLIGVWSKICSGSKICISAHLTFKVPKPGAAWFEKSVEKPPELSQTLFIGPA